MLDVLVWIFWLTFGGYAFWFLTRAKRSEPMTLDELVILWKIHKQQAECRVPISKVKPIVATGLDEFSGFRCECGYEYLSKRPIIQRHAFEQDMFAALSMGTKQSSTLRK